ncbi:MAG: multi-sensor hybrid histidine kinase [Bradyrhizobium sp.]|nr:multi-sensor hybrid histidine kinase [Bradyrhizobium sp.]
MPIRLIEPILDSMLDAVVVIDADGDVVAWNEVAVQTFGWTSAEAIGRSMGDLIVPPQHRDAHRAGMARFQATGEASVLNRRIEISGRDKTGREFPIELAIVAAPASIGNLFIGFLRDISGRHEAGTRLALSEESLRLATQAAEIGTWDLDLTTDTLTWSDRTKAMFGISPNVPCSMDDFYAGLHPDDREATGIAFSSALDPATAASYDVQYRTIGKEDGIVRWVAAKGRGLFEDGRCVRAVGTAIDITERKAAEARAAFMLELTDVLRGTDTVIALDRVSALMGSYFAVSRVGYGHLDPVEDVFDYNVCWTDGSVPPLLGRFPASAFGVKIVAKLTAGETVVVDDLFADVISDEAQTRATASEVDTRAILVVPFVSEGRLRTIVYLNDRPARHWRADEIAFMEEVAERTRQVIARGEAEAALRQLNATLEARVEERTAELREAEAALRQSQKMEAVGRLTGGIAHDFNNLLTVILGSTELLQRPNLTEERRKRHVQAIADTAGRATKLTSQLLSFARRQALTPCVFDVGGNVSALRDMITTLAGSRIRVEIHKADDPCFVDADPSQFDTAIVNMAVNARDAMDGAGRLTIGVAAIGSIPGANGSDATAGEHVAISLTDTGTGIAEDKLDHIFEPFFTTKGVGQGTGLGLSQVFGFAKQSGGDIHVQSELGRGTTFTLYLPRVSAIDGARDEVAADQPLVDGDGACVLVVEDNADVGTFALLTLKELGYHTVLAADAAAALSELAADSDRFDVVFSDIVMPGMDGIELGHEIRRLYLDLPVILTSGYSHILAQNGAAGFELLHKPYSIEQVSRMLAKAAGWRHRAR